MLYLNVLDWKGARRICRAAMDILERTGVEMDHPQAVRMLIRAGGSQDSSGRVRIPSPLVQEAIEVAPKSISVANRKGAPAIVLEGRRSYFGSQIGCPNIIDPYTGERRPFVRKDAALSARVTDFLPNMDFMVISSFAADVKTEEVDEVIFKETVQHTLKPIVFSALRPESAERIIHMAAAIAGGMEKLRECPFILHYAEPITPLFHSRQGVSKLLLCADYGIPLVYTPMLMLGSTGPATSAGILALCTAESLCGLVMAQLRREGAPFVFGGIPTAMDMSTQICSYGAAELDRQCSALADIAHELGLPVYGTAGCSDSKVVDEQAAVELSISCLMAAFSGANLIHDVGILEFANTVSLEMMVLADEVVDMIQHIGRTVEVNEETLALDVIHKVGPRGHFLNEEHTLRHFRECWYPTLFDRRRYDAWKAGGGQSLRERLRQKVIQILAEHEVEPLSQEVIAAWADVEWKEGERKCISALSRAYA